MSPVQKLLYMGKRSMGALEFRPAIRGSANAQKRRPLEIADLVEQARKLIEGETAAAVAEIMQVGSSAGGARPKAIKHDGQQVIDRVRAALDKWDALAQQGGVSATYIAQIKSRFRLK